MTRYASCAFCGKPAHYELATGHRACRECDALGGVVFADDPADSLFDAVVEVRTEAPRRRSTRRTRRHP